MQEQPLIPMSKSGYGALQSPPTCYEDPVPGNAWSILWDEQFTGLALGLCMGVIPSRGVQGS